MSDVDEDLDLHLTDGRIVRIAGLATSHTPAGTRAELAAWLTHATVRVAPLRAELDRWGRVAALVFAAPSAEPSRSVSVSEALLDAGQALARPDPALESCWRNDLRLERTAQEARRGLWAGSPVLDPGDAAEFQANAGSMTLVAGRIAAVREGRARLYLRFADDEGTGMAVAMALPLVRRMAKSGMDPHGWVGRRLRVRGLLDDRWGWQIEVTTAQQLEIDLP